MKEYISPDFDITVYEIEDVITTLSIGSGDVDGGNSGWWG